MNKHILILITLFTGVLLAGYFFYQFKTDNKNSPTLLSKPPENDSPRIISTKPADLENSIVSATAVIEITFNRPLENVGEFKLRIEPKIDIKIELSSDRKTARIIPTKALELGASYTLFIGTDTKFDGVGAWGQEKIYHFKTVKYTGV